jgi:hypothetical protein
MIQGILTGSVLVFAILLGFGLGRDLVVAVRHKLKPPEVPSKNSKYWVAWLQVESISQLYYIVQIIASVIASLVAYSYGPWGPSVVFLISAILFPTNAELVFYILRGERKGSPSSQSRFGGAFFAYLADRLMDAGRFDDAIKYLRYSLEIEQECFRSEGFRLKSMPRVIAMLKVLEARRESTPTLPLKKIAGFLSGLPTYQFYEQELDAFLSSIPWEKDIEVLPDEDEPSPFMKLVQGGVIGALVSVATAVVVAAERIYPLETKSLISGILGALPTVLASLSEVFPVIIWIVPLFWAAGRVASGPEYSVRWSDVASLS